MSFILSCAGASKKQRLVVVVSRHQLLQQFTSLKAAVDAAAETSPSSGSPALGHDRESLLNGGVSGEITEDFNTCYKALKVQHASSYMAAWSSLLKTATFSLWLSGNVMPNEGIT